MASFEFTSPEGKTYQVDGPEGATKEQAFGILQQQLGPSKDIPTGVRGGMEAVASLGTGAVAGPISGYAGILGSVLPGPQGQGAEWAKNVQNALTYQPRTDMGKRSLNAVTYPFQKLSELADKAGGAVTDKTQNPLLSTAANAAVNMAPALLGPASKLIASTLPLDATEATAAGYRLTPTQLGSGPVSRAMEGLSGSAKMEKLASVKNQQVTNDLTKQELSLPQDQPITVRSLENIRKQQGQAYEDVKSSVKLIKPDAQFKADIQGLRGDFTAAAKDYPDLIKNDAVENLIKSLDVNASPRSMVELTRKLRSDATSNLKAYDDPGKQALGFAQRNASAALEDMIDRALTSVGKTDLVQRWKDARQTIAKTHDVEAALNETTGDVSAKYLGKLLDKGKPMSGNLGTSARAARAFEGSLRDVSKMRDQSEFSYGDLLLGALGGGGMHFAGAWLGGLPGLGLVLARPTARHLLLSRGAQYNVAPMNPYLPALAPSLGLKGALGD